MRKLCLALAALSLGACATVPKSIETASGRPEKVFHNIPPDRVQAKLSEYCLKGKTVIELSTPSQVLCSMDAEGGDAVLATLALGNAYSTTPKFKIRLTIVPVGTDTMVQAYQWVELQMAMGQVRQAEMNSGSQFNGAQRMLDLAAAELERASPPKAPK